MNILSFLKYSIIFIIVLLAIVILIIALPFNFSDNEEGPSPNRNNCLDPQSLNAIRYGGCYDAQSKTLFFELNNKNLLDDTMRVEISFFDYTQNTFKLNIPKFNSSNFHKIPASRNPHSLEIYIREENNKYCSTPIDLQIKPCPPGVSREGNTTLKLISTTLIKDFIPVQETVTDQMPLDLIDSETAWESICKSNWKCESWGYCENNFQKRSCIDSSKCQIPTLVPQRVRACDVECEENWRCQWSECKNGFTVPVCKDLNSCGSLVKRPTKKPCEEQCTPDITCGEWSECLADYDFITLSKGDYSLKGKQTRSCIDKKSCVSQTIETKECSLIIDVYTKVFAKCGKEYIGVYNKIDDKLLANFEKSRSKDILNIDLSGATAETYCDYCFDGILDGDEDQIDCGGSCSSCDERRVDTRYSKNFFERFLDALFSFLS